MNETAFDRLIAALARGNDEWARDYLTHFPRTERAVPAIRAGLAQRVTPGAMAEFERVAPWLLSDDANDTPARVLAALREAGAEGLTASELAERLRRVPTEDIAAAVNTMREAGDVMVERKRTKGRIAYVHRLAEFARGKATVDEMANPFAFTPEPMVE